MKKQSDQSEIAIESVWENPVKKLLREGKPVVGATITVNSVEIAVQTASLGFDFLWLEMEHSPISLETVRNIVLATRGLKAVPLARIPVNELWMAKRVLDAGVLGVVFPFTSTPALARQAVAACRYPPAERRGSGATLATFRWPAPEGYYDFADRNVLVIAMIEDSRGVERIDQIAATPGVDVVFIGPSDLSFSLGLRGEQNHPKLQRAITKVVTSVQRHKKVLGRIVNGPEEIKRWLDQGYLFFQAPTELHFMKAGVKNLLGPLGKSIEAVKSRTFY